MAVKLIIVSEAEQDIANVYVWYEDQHISYLP